MRRRDVLQVIAGAMTTVPCHVAVFARGYQTPSSAIRRIAGLSLSTQPISKSLNQHGSSPGSAGEAAKV